MPPYQLSLASPAPPSLRELLARFDPAAFDRAVRLPGNFVWLAHPFEYTVGPRMEGERLTAVLFGRGDRRSGGTMVEVLALAPALFSLCSHPGHYRACCEHVRAVLADLAACPELREAVATGHPPEPALAILANLRFQRHVHAQVQGALDRWAPDAPGARSITLEVSVEGDRFDSDSLYGGAMLALRFKAPPSRKVLEYSALEDLRLPPEMRRLVALSERSYGRKRGVLVENCRVASALEILKAHPEWGVSGVSFVEAPLRMFVRRDKRPKAEALAHFNVTVPRTSERQGTGLVDLLEARWRSEDGAIDLAFGDALLFPGPTSFVRQRRGGPFFPVDPSVDIAVAQRMDSTPLLPIPTGAEEPFFRQLQARLRGRGVGLPSRASMGLPELGVPDLAVRIDGSPLDFEALLEAVYSGDPIPVAGDGEDLRGGADGHSRDDELERAAAERLLAAGLVWDRGARRFRPADEDSAVAFWETGIGMLRGEGSPRLDVYLSDRLAGVRVRGPIRSRVTSSLVGNWLETQVSFEADDVSAELVALREALARKRRWVLLKDGTIAHFGAGTEDLAKAVEAVLDDEGEGRLSVAQVGLLDHWAGAAESVEIDARLEQLRARLRTLDLRPAEMPRDFRATLRPYQVQGLAWLQFLDELGTGGVLADDMGLGKTLMTLAFLAKKKEAKGACPTLVVCPTSVVGNWLREAARFTPGLSALSLAGSNRAERFGRIPESDLVVTTYALLRLDIEALQGFDFRAVVLDEAQNIKNASAATTQAARRLRGQQKLALTGTPVENRLGELWSILEYCNPGMLGSERSFQSRFERAVAAEPGGAAAAELRARVRPFVLRRSKAQVLTDLPPKEEIDVPCLPGPAQRKAYDVLAEMMRKDVESSIATRGFGQSGIMVLTALLRLRQMCCDPRLVDATRPASQSAKREAFLALVRELVAEGRRALVFSQFVELLHLWREDLDREGIEYVYLDGSTLHRDKVVARFQEGDAPLFLLSLKAGGSGLNLTAADTVIHCDPWWNPAVEAQATDRTHRIGQTRSVTVYRLVLRGTIEEKIAELKARKRAIAEAIVREDAGEMRGLDEDDVRLLLSGVDTGADVEVTMMEEPSGPVAAPAPAPRLPAKRGRRPNLPLAELPVGEAGSGARETDGRAGGERAGEALAAGDVHGEALRKLVADILAHLRETRITQRAFAARVGFSEVTLSRLLRGHLQSIDRPVAARMLHAMLSRG